MTKEEAIEQFQNAIDLIKQNGKDWLDERDIPLLTMAIKALEQTDGDLISRDNAIELVNYALAENKDVLEVLENMPSAEKTAEWISKDGIFGVVYCSKCDYELHTNDTNYCPNCGRRMKGVEEE